VSKEAVGKKGVCDGWRLVGLSFFFNEKKEWSLTFFFDNERISSYAVVYNGEETSKVYWGTENKAFSAVLSTDTFLASQEERLAEQSYAYRIARRFDSGL
jgi:hypothetical protein